MRVRALVALAVVTAVVSVGGSAFADTTTTTTAGEPAHTPTAHPFSGMSTVGPLFLPGSSSHFCTASVVDSAAGDLLITAAHCLVGSVVGYTFAPGYHHGIEPFGSWTVVGAYAPSGWMTHQAAQDDVALLKVAPRQVDGRTTEIESMTGGNRLDIAPATGQEITAPAYDLGHDDDPITCAARVYYHDRYPAFDCNPYPDGTSGAPWLRRTDHGWDVVGVIGGLHQGGCETWTSYSPTFDQALLHTLSDAGHGPPVASLPAAGSDGCTTGL
jgi:V8-like Glu-specific endopeptidase